MWALIMVLREAKDPREDTMMLTPDIMVVEDTIPREAKEVMVDTTELDTMMTDTMMTDTMVVEDTIPREAKEVMVDTTELDTTVVIAMEVMEEVEDTIPRDPREAHTAMALTLAQMDTCTMGAMMEDTIMTDTMVVVTIPRVAKEETVVIAMEVMKEEEVGDTTQKEVREVEVEVIVSPSTPLLP